MGYLSFFSWPELPHQDKLKSSDASPLLSELPKISSGGKPASDNEDHSPENREDEETSSSQSLPEEVDSAPEESSDDGSESEEEPGGAISTTITGEGGGYHKGAEGIYLKNNTEYEIDVEGLLNEPLGFSASEGAKVLIVHTHGSEAYMPDGDDVYEPSDPSRTEDTNYNVVRVGDELEKVLTQRGISVIHDRELYDYPQL